jgi:hypothetical protein
MKKKIRKIRRLFSDKIRNSKNYVPREIMKIINHQAISIPFILLKKENIKRVKLKEIKARNPILTNTCIEGEKILIMIEVIHKMIKIT